MVIDRVADTLERLSIEMDALSETVFRPTNPADRRRTVEYQDVLREIGRKGELNAKIQESLLSIGRVASYLEQALLAGRPARDLRGRVKTLGRDVATLGDPAHFLSDRVTSLMTDTRSLTNIATRGVLIRKRVA